MNLTKIICSAAFVCVSCLSVAAADEQQPIVSPEGKTVSYARAGRMHYPYGQYMAKESYVWYATEVVFGDNNDIYLKNPFMNFVTNSYIKGTIEGDKVIVKLPQIIYSEGDTKYYVYRMLYDYSQEPTFLIDEEESDITFDYADGVLTMEDHGDDVVALGVIDEQGDWKDMAESIQVYSEMTDELAPAPEGLATTEWDFNFVGGAHKVELGFTQDECWIKGISPNFPDVWVHGKAIRHDNGHKSIIIPSKQYIGVSPITRKHTYFMTTEVYTYDYVHYGMEEVNEFILDHNEAAGTIASADEFISYAVNINTGNSLLGFVEYYLDFNFTTEPGAAEILPEDPASVEYYDLQGVRLATPQPGVLVKLLRYANGTTKAIKIVNK